LAGEVLANDAQPTERRILEAASRLFYERGYHATTMRDLASDVGVKAASLYNHFPGKQDILVRLCLDGMREFYDGALGCIEGLSDIRDRMRALIVWQVMAETRDPYASRVSDEQMNALNPKSRKELIKLRKAFERLISDLLDEGQAMGVWQMPNQRIVCLGIISICKVDSWYAKSGPLTPEQIGDIYATFVLRALESSKAQ
jgi:AcrR family transcriptional regulator